MDTSTDVSTASSEIGRHTATIRIPFHHPSHALIAKRAIQVDRELNAHLIERKMHLEGEVLVVTYSATTTRLLRLATNGFMEHLNLIVRTVHEFGPVPSTAGEGLDEAEGVGRAERLKEAGGVEV